MRNTVLVALAAVALASGCNDRSATSNGNGGAPTAVTQASSVKGEVRLRDSEAKLSSDAQLTLELGDVSRPDDVLAEQVMEVSGSGPFAFELDFEPERVAAGRDYVVSALITDGERRYVQPINYPVLTRGHGNEVQIVLNTEPTAGERLKEEFTRLRNHIGGMRMLQGTSLRDDLSVGWDAFVENGEIRFMRVIEETADGRKNTEYAFADGEPMALTQRNGATITLGWNSDGELVLNQISGAGKASDETVQALRASANAALEMGQAKLEAERKR